MGGLPHCLARAYQPGDSRAVVSEPSSLAATGRDSIQAAMSLSFHLTAVEPTFPGRGKSPVK